jgi:myo-inositol-1-phosphate synthase
MIKTALFGAGNSAEAVIGVVKGRVTTGIWHQKVGGFGVEDIDVCGAFDIDPSRVGELRGVTVLPGIELDPPPENLTPRKLAIVTEEELMNKLSALKPDVAVNLISSGQINSSRAYAKICLNLGIPFVNATSASIARDETIRRQFENSKVALAGDDLMSQLGGTALHRGLIDFLNSRGVKVLKSYQLDVGGSSDTLNTIREDVRAQKRDIKSRAISSELDTPVETVAGTTDYVEFLGSRRTVYLWLEVLGPLGEPFTLDVFFKSSDPANGANVVLDLIRAVHFDTRRGKAGTSDVLCSYAFKNPPRIRKSRKALELFESEYIF